MSQDYFPSASKGKAPAAASGQDDNQADTQPPSTSARPAYMTVGTGSTSQHATRLQSILDNDSGYGGSIAGDEAALSKLPLGSSRTDPSLSADMPLNRRPTGNPETDQRNQLAAISQLWYNQQRVALGRSINRVLELLEGLQEMNVTWPAHYPSVQRADATSNGRRPSSSSSSRPVLQHAFSMAPGEPSIPHGHPAHLRRTMTNFVDHEAAAAESSKDAESKVAADAPRLVTPQIAQEFSVLKLDLKLGALHQTELVHSLEKGSVASLLDGKIRTSMKHLASLRERIDDTASKVLVTGDLNAGKSTFCNALLRRKVLPEDQQPCTSIFCEVLDARENGGIEEVHAVHMDAVYNRHDESTYDVFPMKDLEKIVIDNTTYMQCKVYVKDVRSIDESLLNNGVVDIALIDAPGLNSDTTKTTAIFARQEEIDVVVFVVSAANHFTQSAKEFIWAAASEKAYIFMVVNGYDMIRDKERCQKMILDQVYGLSHQTFKESTELVHFVSSNAVPMAPSPPGGPGGSGGGSSSGGGGGDDPSDDPKGKGKEKEKVQDFEKLEQSLRRFVLEKRARSKLAPAKTYLTNILNDVNVLATVNSEVAQSELDRVTRDLQVLEPQLESSKKAKAEVSDQIDQTIDETCKEIYDHTRTTLNSAITHAGDSNLGVPYPGLFNAFQYAEDLKEAMLSEISSSVTACEENARARTVGGVNAIKQLGLLHLGNEYHDLNFRSDVMFKRRRDLLAKQIDIPTEFWDFVDWSTVLQRQEKVAGTGMALTVATAVGGRLVGGMGWMDHALSAVKIVGNDNLRRMIIPGLVIAVVSATAYVLRQIPQSLPHRLSTKLSTQLAAIDYVHSNSTRISSSVRKVLRFPADNLRVALTRSVEQLGARREETVKVRKESEVALKYFSNLVRNSAHQRALVEEVDLEAHPQGALGISTSS
ncbi:Uu.00g003760.m01.CDS01 [Anthostomella pinea]|uniref:Uu.00g003760.m01.CDS01 n=1 Tax=Anthostomella pinea TaxID=933095 RepID=A0AAI8VJT2_9PEZI|nr:Uu.00g003760.m01.CDS01 [Anthostomella pinea]